MKTQAFLLLAALAASVIYQPSAQAAAPQMIHYQGYITVNSQPFSGQGQFKFALVDKPGTSTYWSHDGTSVGGAAPSGSLSNITVFKGVYSVLLGDRSVTGMTQPVAASVFSDRTDVFLRVWFNDGTNGVQQLAPDTRIASVGYALSAQTVSDGAIDSASLAPAITLGGSNAVGSLSVVSSGGQLRASLDAGAQGASGSLKLYDVAGSLETVRLVGSESGASGAQMLLKNAAGNATLELDAQEGTNSAAGGMVRLKKNDGKIVASLEADLDQGNSGLLLYNAAGTKETVRLTGAEQGTRAGFLGLKNGNGNTTVKISAQETDDAVSASVLQLVRNDGKQTAALRSAFGGTDGGALQLANSDGNNTVELAGDGGENQGRLILKHSNLSNRVRIDADGPNDSGEAKLYDADGTETIQILGANSLSKGGVMNLRDSDGTTTIALNADDSNEGGRLDLSQGDGTATVALIADDANDGGRIEVRKSDGTTTARLEANLGSGNGGLVMYDPQGGESIRLTGAFQGTGAGFLQFRNLAGAVTMSLNGDSNGEGRLTAQVIEITGGSDLSEQFDVAGLNHEKASPGNIVCIDPSRPGELRLSNEPYDATVAGVISGAGGVKPGMLMGQRGTRADGRLPVALTGRVYCSVDASFGAVKPGDLITTSATPGHGMKAEAGRAAGSVVGKAMTALESGRGLVLVLVSLQ